MSEKYPKVSFDRIQFLLGQVEYTYSIVPKTTTTLCIATLIQGSQTFTLAIEKSACVDPRNFDQADGEKYAKERCEQSVVNKLWEFEGYKLFMGINECKIR